MTAQVRIAILPREVATEVMTAAMARGTLAVAAVLLLLDIPVVIDVFLARDLGGEVAAPLAALCISLALLALYARVPNWRTRALYLAGAATSAIFYQVVLATTDPSLMTAGTYVFNRPIVALVLVAPLVARPLRGILWASAGVVLGLVVTAIVSLVLAVPVPVGWGPFAAWTLCVAVYAALGIMRARQASTVPDLAALEQETRRLDLQDQFEQRAAALIHDTVLSDLTAIMATNGTLDERARDRFRADVATLADPSWLREPAVALSVDSSDVALRNGIIALVSEYQWRGLTVDITGDNFDIIPLDHDAITAVLGALRACLENVLQHSGTRLAELMVIPGATEVTFMVVDHGTGFEPENVADDRLGLRTSVVHRVQRFGGEVRIWSRPDSGTSVVLRFPVAQRASSAGGNDGDRDDYGH